MNHKDRMLSELPYKAWLDGLSEERLETRKKLYQYNHTLPEEEQLLESQIRSILRKAGRSIKVEPPFRCDYGWNIEVGDGFYANFNCTILDVAKVTIGNNAMFGPNVALYTAGHPIHPASRNSGYEYGVGICIGNNVWLGGNVVVNPGVHISDNVVVGAGSVVTKNLPANVMAAGNPCRILREISEKDREYFYKSRVFDVNDY